VPAPDSELPVGLRYLERELRVLMIGAHPDDEDNGLLTYLHHVEAARTAYLSLTRGEGGQNYLGPQLGAQLGLLRTGELLAARRFDGAEQRFTSATDFGFSKSADEALSIWGRERILGEVVREVRRFRPDLIVSIFSGAPEDGHGQHQAAGLLAREALAAAADPERFPEQLCGGLRPWRAPRFYVDRFFRDEQRQRTWTFDLGHWVLPLGLPVSVLGARGRSQHRSQAMGTAELLEARSGGLQRVEPELAEGAIEDRLSAGLLVELGDLPRRFELPAPIELTVALGDFAAAAEEARRSYAALEPERSAPALAAAALALRRAQRALPPQSRGAEQIEFRLKARHERVLELLEAALGVELHGVANRPFLVPGDELVVQHHQLRTRAAVEIEEPSGPELGSGLSARGVEVERLEPAPDGAPPEGDYRLRMGASAVDEIAMVAAQGLPRDGAALPAPAAQESWKLEYRGLRWSRSVPLTYRWVDPGLGQRESTVWAAPRVSLEPIMARVFLTREATKTEVQVRVRNHAAAAVRAELRLGGLPHRSDLKQTLELAPGQIAVRRFDLELPVEGPERIELQTGLQLEGGVWVDRAYQPWEYEHVDLPPWSAPARLEIVRLPVARPVLRVGFVIGTGEQTPAILRQLGAEVVELAPSDLAADLSAWDALILGIRAYEAHPELARWNPRLFDYVREGGVLLVEYQTGDFLAGELGPYPMTFDRRAARVTEEDAPVLFLRPEDPVLQQPYRLDPEDFRGWVQERGLYFASAWDERYRAPLASHDRGEQPQAGGLLIAELGRGRYIYSGWSFFRQLPAGVPGAFKLFLNLLQGGPTDAAVD